MASPRQALMTVRVLGALALLGTGVVVYALDGMDGGGGDQKLAMTCTALALGQVGNMSVEKLDDTMDLCEHRQGKSAGKGQPAGQPAAGAGARPGAGGGRQQQGAAGSFLQDICAVMKAGKIEGGVRSDVRKRLKERCAHAPAGGARPGRKGQPGSGAGWRPQGGRRPAGPGQRPGGRRPGAQRPGRLAQRPGGAGQVRGGQQPGGAMPGGRPGAQRPGGQGQGPGGAGQVRGGQQPGGAMPGGRPGAQRPGGQGQGAGGQYGGRHPGAPGQRPGGQFAGGQGPRR